MFVVKNWVRKSTCIIGLAAGLALSLPVNASVLDFWSADGWEMLDAEDGVGSGGYVGPGWGGQAFDAEYLFYKKEGGILSIGLQSGFDLSDGHQVSGRKSYYAGDLALAFNGGSYDYAIDFGLVTKDYHGNDNVGVGAGNQDAAGLYHVTQWNNDIAFAVSSPFAMDEGSLLASLTGASNGSESKADGLSYYRTASFDLAALGFDVADFSAHWTMSCGNDVVEGSAAVPEPSALLLMAGGLFGLMGGRKLKGRSRKA
jgi:hypothetical protein